MNTVDGTLGAELGVWDALPTMVCKHTYLPRRPVWGG